MSNMSDAWEIAICNVPLGLYPGILGMGPFSKNWEKFWLFGNENSRCKLQNLGILHDFKEISIGKGASFLPL